MKIPKYSILNQLLLIFLCVHGQLNAIASPVNAIASPEDMCGSKASDELFKLSDDGKFINTKITICAFSVKTNKAGGKEYKGLGEVDFMITKSTEKDRCETDFYRDDGINKNIIGCDDVTSEDGEMKCDMKCPKNYTRTKRYRLVFCGDTLDDYVPAQGNMSFASKPKDIAFHVQECRVKESDGIWSSHQKWNTLYFNLEEKSHKQRRNASRSGF